MMDPAHGSFGYFKRGEARFWGDVEERSVRPRVAAPLWFEGPHAPPEQPQSLADLVLLPPARPRHIVLFDPQTAGLHLLAPSALVPHRGLVSVPHIRNITRMRAAWVGVIGHHARRLKASQCGETIAAWCLGQASCDATLAGDPLQIGRSRLFESFLALGPWLRSDPPDSGAVELWHNGDLAQSFDLAACALRPEHLVSITDSVTLWPGDLVCVEGGGEGALIQPGDHAEVAGPGGMRLATNVGMRGSA